MQEKGLLFCYDSVVLLASVPSKNRVQIRLTDERWHHIILSHPEIAENDVSEIIDAVQNPEAILQGDTGELLAVKRKTGKKHWIVVAYKEVTAEDGFVITAYVTTDTRWLFQRKVLWSSK